MSTKAERAERAKHHILPIKINGVRVDADVREDKRGARIGYTTAIRYVQMYTGSTGGSDDPIIKAIAAHMVDTGECVYHAAAQVTGKPCRCHACRNKENA